MEFDSIFTSEKRLTWSDISHWKGLVELLNISARDNNAAGAPKHCAKLPPTSVADGRQRQARLVDDGYALVDEKFEESLTTKLKDAITELHKRGYPATFVLLYDETWELARVALETLSDATHPSNVFNFDMLAWYIDPAENVAGFSPHRDRQPQDAKSSFHEDGSAKYVTLWTALSNATPENSCLYVIPKQCDPGYIEGDCDGANGENDDPMSRALSTKESFQNIRALPRQAGQSVLFTHRILHWGSRGNPHSSGERNEPRVAISFVCSEPAFEEPYLKESPFPPLFETRLLLVCAQLLIYYQRFNLSKSCIRACYEYVKEHSDELTTSYRKKIIVEFVKAMKESAGDDGNESDEDVLEAMLDAEQGGYGEFEDDFDELNGESTGLPADDDDESDEEEVQDATFLFGKRPPETANGHSNGKKRKEK